MAKQEQDFSRLTNFFREKAKRYRYFNIKTGLRDISDESLHTLLNTAFCKAGGSESSKMYNVFNMRYYHGIALKDLDEVGLALDMTESQVESNLNSFMTKAMFYLDILDTAYHDYGGKDYRPEIIDSKYRVTLPHTLATGHIAFIYFTDGRKEQLSQGDVISQELLEDEEISYIKLFAILDEEDHTLMIKIQRRTVGAILKALGL